MAESFVTPLKKELLDRCAWPTRNEARSAIFEYVESYYNPLSRHSALGYLIPIEYEGSMMITTTAVWTSTVHHTGTSPVEYPSVNGTERR